MAFNFPDAPDVDDKYGNYTWDGEKWVLPRVDITLEFIELFGVEHPDQLFLLHIAAGQ